ncbi:MAG: ATP-binding protein, partial [Candidatus Riflebacteria bacterium]
NFEKLQSDFNFKSEFVLEKNYKSILQKLQSSQIDAAVLSSIHSDYYLHQYGIKPSSIVFAPFGVYFAMPRGSDRSHIIAAINRSTQRWLKDKNSFYYQTLKKWHARMSAPPPVDHTNLYLAIGASIVMMVFLLAALRYSQFKVRQKTRELRQAIDDVNVRIELLKQYEKNLFAQKEQYRAVTETSKEMILRFDSNCRIIFANQCAISSFGLDEEEGIFNLRLIDNHLDESFVHTIEKAIDKIFKSKVSDELELEFSSREGKKNLEIIMNPEFCEDGTVKSVVAVARDISSRKITEEQNIELEKKLQHAMRLEAIGTLAGGIAHDINNILTPILGYSEILSGDLGQNHPDYDSACEIYKAALRGKDLANQILIFSRQTETRKCQVYLDESVKETLKLIRAGLPATIEILLDFPDTCPPIFADPTQIHQLILNLITNSFYAMRDNGGVLIIGLAEAELTAPRDDIRLKAGNYVVLSVSDTGTGIQPEVIERIFEPYYTTKSQEGGSGLGLFMVHSIVSKLHGAIELKSEIGRGTCFKVFFPVSNQVETPVKVDPHKQVARGCGQKIMVVDDEEAIVKLHERSLIKHGFEVITFTSPEKALDFFKNDPAGVDLVITDMTMPILEGDQLSKDILKIKPQQPIIICTGYSHSITAEKAKALGVKFLLLKPLVPSELFSAIDQCLKISTSKEA